MKTTKVRPGQTIVSSELAPFSRVRALIDLCRKFIYEYYETDAPWSGPDWWRSFNAAGIGLRDALEEEKASEGQQPLRNEEREQAYLLLIRVAYFFEPLGVAELFFLEQGWLRLQEQARAEQVTAARASASRWAFAKALLQRFRTALQRARHRDARQESASATPGTQPRQTASLPSSPARQKAGVPQR